jgi:hypothetical protein
MTTIFLNYCQEISYSGFFHTSPGLMDCDSEDEEYTGINVPPPFSFGVLISYNITTSGRKSPKGKNTTAKIIKNKIIDAIIM